MFKDKKLIVLLVVIILEVLAIVAIPVVYQLSMVSEDDDDEEEYEDESNNISIYCQIYDDEKCEGILEAEDEPIDTETNYYGIDPEMYGDVFLNVYSSILKGEPISEEQFSYFTILSEYFSDEYSTDYVTNESFPTTFYAKTFKNKLSPQEYPYNVIRRIAFDMPEEECAIFDFSPDFSMLNDHLIQEGACNGNI